MISWLIAICGVLGQGIWVTKSKITVVAAAEDDKDVYKGENLQVFRFFPKRFHMQHVS